MYCRCFRIYKNMQIINELKVMVIWISVLCEYNGQNQAKLLNMIKRIVFVEIIQCRAIYDHFRAYIN
uniref:Uncharacterized protein n=1 Tax=Grateloupia filicina TaxID=31455 RepID=A0A2S1FXE3_9FLOR|nr:hypothetical protein Grafi_p171 [Grateloupia filicina]AWD77437.1 hypothetical protein Grafi_p171 [Grateloupia filicina]